ncbi:MAG: penicillin-binding protein [Lutibacter sp.]|uniref:transglycosylase domain-containing protein n=1 Tax=Lutibacter sp. TaxID=1925666 RepID=UPI001793B5D2|nr:transglycosylase domain-containing protein [Lutibacter sp.]MBT8316337.1 transglycosylase domain-containing protein [Lutibacter sp.]NNJ57197.1 penicillin-binding protein [Lutibacter sp.]
MKKNTTTKNNFFIYIKWFWIVILGGTSALILLFLLASWGVFGALPSFEELENPEKNLASEVISIDGKTLGKYFKENRTPVKFKDLPDNLIKALVATEDERFYDHSGIDFKSTFRAVAKMGKGGGGSTITQQLAKLLFHGEGSRSLPERILQKVKEYVIAIKLERQYTKQEILTMYLNKYDFLNLAVGIRSASRIYFGKEPIDLKVSESAMLVGMLKNSSLFNPLKEYRVDTVLHRRNVVLKQMERNNFISKKLKDSLQLNDLGLDVHREDHSDGSATYFREYLRDFMKTWIKNNPKPDGSQYDLHRDGLKIYVTLDSRMQMYAEEAMNEHMSNLQRIFFKEQKRNRTAPFYDLDRKQITSTLEQAMKRSNRWRQMKKSGASEKEIRASFDKKVNMKVFSYKGDIDTILSPKDSIRYYKHILRSGLLSVEPESGHVKAWVGGVDYKHFQFDAVKQQKRQVGSTFKPFVYATAINQLNLSPCDKFPNTPYTIPKEKYGMPEDWTPKNSSDDYGGELTLKQALAGSVNVITAKLIDMVNPQNVVSLAKRAGIKSEIPAVPAIALGSVDLSLYEMVGAYATFANKGLQVEPMMLLKIEDKNGTVLEQFVPNSKEVLSEESAFVVINLLEGVTDGGSGIRLRTKWGSYPDNVATGYPYEFTNPIAGKTGTTQNQSDGWFMGIVPNLATGVWVGAEDRATHFAGITYGQGASMALPIWALYYKKLYADANLNISQDEFEKPKNLSIKVNCDETNVDGDNLDDIIEEDPEF